MTDVEQEESPIWKMIETTAKTEREMRELSTETLLENAATGIGTQKALTASLLTIIADMSSAAFAGDHQESMDIMHVVIGCLRDNVATSMVNGSLHREFKRRGLDMEEEVSKMERKNG